MSKKTSIKDDYYKMAILDLENGSSMDDLRLLLKEYEERELYEACAGIHKAIENARFWTLLNMTEERKDLHDKITINFKEDEQ